MKENGSAFRNGYNCVVVLFDSTHQALRGEQALKAERLEHAVINAPRDFTADCGIALRLAPELRDVAERTLAGAGVLFSSIEPYRCKWI